MKPMNGDCTCKHYMVFCVNFCSYDHLHTLMESVERAAAKASGLCCITLCVGDNTATDWQGIPENLTPHCTLKSFPYHLNIGYLGCALRMMAEVGWQEVSQASYCIICTPHITLNEDFFCVLAATKWPDDAGWLAPDILTTQPNCHERPYSMHRPTRRDFHFWHLLYSHHIIYMRLEKWLRLLDRLKPKHTKQRAVFSGHRSLMILSGKFLAKNPYQKFPTFLYGEELFWAELVRLEKMKTYYCPSLLATHKKQMTTGTRNYQWYCRQKDKSLHILKEYSFHYF